MPVPINIDPVISSRVKAAWARLTAAQQSQLAPAILDANSQAVQVAQSGIAPLAPATPHTLTLARSALTGDTDAVVSSVDAAAPAVVGPDGVIWGAGKWQQFDPGCRGIRRLS
jgi:hypothetical protein